MSEPEVVEQKIAEMTRGELLCILGAVEFAIYAGEKSLATMSENKKETLEELKSVKSKVGALLGISSKTMEKLDKKAREHFDE